MAPCPTLKSQAKPCTSDDENRPDSQTSLDILMTVREMLETVCASQLRKVLEISNMNF